MTIWIISLNSIIWASRPGGSRRMARAVLVGEVACGPSSDCPRDFLEAGVASQDLHHAVLAHRPHALAPGLRGDGVRGCAGDDHLGDRLADDQQFIDAKPS